MRLVRINDLSEEERKKALKEQQERNERNARLREENQREVNNNFNNFINQKQETNLQPTNKSNTIWDKVVNIANTTGKIGQNFGLGLTSGLVNFQQSFQRATDKTMNDRFKMNDEMLKKRLSNKDYEEYQKNNKLSLYNQQKAQQESLNKWQDNKMQMQQKMAQNTESIDGKIGKKLSELAPSIGQMIPGMIPGAGTIYFGGSAVGSYYDEAKQRGMNEDEATIFAGLMGLAEGATEMIGIENIKKAGKTTKALIKGAGKQAVKETGEQIGKATIKQALKEYGIGIADNAIQEAIIDPIQEITATAVAGKDKAQWNNIGKKMLDDAINGGLVSAILGGANMGIQSCTAVVDNYKQGKAPTQAEFKQAVTDASKELDVGQMIIDGVPKDNQTQQVIPQEQLNVLNEQPRDNAMVKNGEAINKIIDNDKYISQEEKNILKDMTNTFVEENKLDNEMINETIEQIKAISQTAQAEVDKLDTGKKYLSGRKEIYRQYMKKQGYDSKIVEQAKELVRPNSQGRRTKEQWLQVAKQIGTNIADKSNKEIQEIAYKSWQEETPNNSGTLNRQGKKYVKFDSDEWIDTIYNQVEKQRQATGYTPTNETLTQLDNLTNEMNKTPVEQPKITTEGLDLIESAKKYNLDTENESIKNINQKLKDRNINSRFDETFFKDSNQNAIWKTTTDEQGNKVREVIFNPKADTNKTIEQVAIHELTHDLAGTKEFEELRDLILDKNKTRKDYAQARQNLEDIYSQVYDKNKDNFKSLVDEEELADTLGQKLGDTEFINNLHQTKPNVFKKVYDWVVDKLNKFTGGKVEKLYWEDVKNKFEKAYRQENKATENTKYSTSMEDIANLIEKKNTFEQRAEKLQKAGDKTWIDVQNEAMRINDQIEDAKIDRYSVSETSLDEQISKLKEEKSKHSLFSEEGQEISKKIKELQTKIDEEKFFKLSIKDLEKIDNGDYTKPDGGKYNFTEITDAYAVLQAKKSGLDSIKEWEEFAKQKQKNIEQERLQKAEQEKQKKLKAEQDKKAKLEKEIKEADPYKLAQYNKIQKYNPMFDDEHVGIRSPADIKTFAETINDKEGFGWGDFSKEDAQEALDKNRITIYSSYPIKQGVFVSTSKIQAEEYAGGPGNQVYSLTVRPNNVAWINGDEGQFAKISQTEQDKIERAKRLPKQDTKYSVSGENKLENRVSGDKLLDAQDLIEEIKSSGANVDENGYVTVYHRTTKENAENIYKTKKMKAKEDGVFFSTSKNGENNSNYGTEIVELKIPAEDLVLDDIFEDEASVKVPLKNKNQILDISNYISDDRLSIGNQGKWNEFLNTQIGETKGTKVKDLKVPIKQSKIENKANINEYNVLYQDNKEVKPNIPIKDSEKVRKTYKSVIESEYATPEAKAIAKKLMGTDTYVPDSNKAELERADARISKNGVDNEAFALAKKVEKDEIFNVDDVATAERLMQYYSKTGEYEKYQDVLQNLAISGSPLGRAIQAYSMLKRMTPQGQALYLQKVINKMNKKIDTRTKGKGQKFNLTPEMTEKIVNSKPNELENVIDEVSRELGQQVPKTLMEKIDAWRYFSMLGNPRTHDRNIVGNVAMGKLQGVKNKIAGGLEAVAQKAGMIDERTKTLKPATKEVKQFAKNDIQNVMDRLNNESKFDTRNLIQQYQRTFKSDLLEKTLGKAFDFNNKALELEDVWGLKSAYKKNMADYMTANKLTPEFLQSDTKEANIQLEKARKYAIQQAQEATFHQESALSSALSQFENKNNGTKLFMGAVLPFKKTPINVAKAGLEYSPVGLVKAFTTDVSKLNKGKITANQYIDNLAKGLTGTGIAFAGYALAEAGILSASRTDDDDKKNRFESNKGKQPFAITIGDKTYSLDWLAPTAIPLFVGAEINQNVKAQEEDKANNSKDFLERLGNSMDAMSKSLNPMVEMSMLSGLAGIIKGFAQENTDQLSNILTNATKSYVNQFFPTLGGQLARTIDPIERSTMSTKKNSLAKAIDQTAKQIQAKTPFASKNLPERTDIWGNIQKQDPNAIKRAMQQFIFPWREKTLKSNVVDNTLSDLFEETGEKKVLPNMSLNKDFTFSGSKYRLTSEEYADYKKEYGKNSYNLLNSLINSDDYKKMGFEKQAKAISEIYSYANEKNKMDYAEKNGITNVKPSTTYKAIEEIKQNGGNETDYFKYIGETLGVDKSKEKINILENINASDKSKKAIYKTTIGKEDDTYRIIDNININEYLKYKQQDFSSDRKDDGTLKGKAISNSKKKKVYNYVNDMRITRNQKLVLLGSQYKLFDDEQEELFDYIDNLPNRTDKEIMKIYSQFGNNFTVYKNGDIEFK